MTESFLQKTAGEISSLIQGEISGDPALLIKGLSAIEANEANTITFFGNPRYERHIYGDQYRAVIVPALYKPRNTDIVTFIKVDNVYEAVSKVADIFSVRPQVQPTGIHAQSLIDPSAQVGEGVSVHAYAIIGKNCILEDGCTIRSHVYLGENVHIGKDTIIHNGVRILDRVSIGARCIIYPNAVIGSEGFGHAISGNSFKKITHQGSVLIEDDVEIGSNTCIDRGSIRDTIIRKGAKLDNLIQVAHGVEIGENVAIAAQAGISGSARIGARTLLGGQVGVAGHVKIAQNSKIQAKSGVASDIKEGDKKWYGYPILSYYDYLRSFALFKRLPELFTRIKRLEEDRED